MATAKKLQAAQRRMDALHLREEGKTFREVGEFFGVTAGRAQQLVRRALRECTAGHRFRHSDVSLSFQEAFELMPLLGFLKEVSDGYCDVHEVELPKL